MSKDRVVKLQGTKWFSCCYGDMIPGYQAISKGNHIDMAIQGGDYLSVKDCLVSGPKVNNVEPLARERSNIAILKQKLINIGYSSGEVEYLIHQFTGKAKINKLGMEDLRALKESLQKQLDLAKKCLEIS